MILLTHISGIANNAVSLSGVVTSLNNNESNRTKFSANVSTFFMEDFLLWLTCFGTGIDTSL